MSPKNIYLGTLFFAITVVGMSCKKNADLAASPDSTLVVINNAEDAQAALDDIPIMRETPSLPEISADAVYLSSDSSLQFMNPIERNAYTWNRDIFQGEGPANDWFYPYRQVYYANSILATLPRLADTANSAVLDVIRGAALFIRAYAFHNLVLEFANLYGTTAASDPGIPLRLDPNPEATSTRATVKDAYEKIIADLKDAAVLLPLVPDPKRKNRPSRPAAFALLARVYLTMGDFTSAKAYADSCLNLYSVLLDYSTIIPTSLSPFDANNEEVLYQSNLLSTTDFFYLPGSYVDSTLYASYSDGDLRKQFFFTIRSTGRPSAGHSYSGDYTEFSGLAIDEVLLIRAECLARQGLLTEAMHDLTSLMKKRWKNNAYNPPAVSSPSDVLELVLQERRKELPFRGLRWSDIRRLNKINPAITLRRWINGKIDTLPPGDPRFIMPIPPDVIAFNTGMPQNPR
jgi:tetratricopeptide (TPR) repeat protein